MRVVVTGGAGFIGSHVVAKLMEMDDDVIVVDNFTTGNLQNLEAPPTLIHNAELVDYNFHEHLAKAEAIIHLAAIPSVQASIADPITSFDVDLGVTVKLAEYAIRRNMKKFVFASSAAVYGESAHPHEEDEKLAPISPYAAYKASAEMILKTLPNQRTDFVSLRLFNVYGPRQNPLSSYSGVMSHLCLAKAQNRRGALHGDGEQVRDFVYVDDVAQAFVDAVHSDNEFDGMAINIASGTSRSVKSIADRLNVACDHGPSRPGDIRQSSAVIARARNWLDFSPKTSFEDGIDQTYTWLKTQLCRFFPMEHKASDS